MPFSRKWPMENMQSYLENVLESENATNGLSLVENGIEKKEITH